MGYKKLRQFSESVEFERTYMELDFVSKRVFLTLPDTVYADLERWADLQGRPVANLANYLVERAIEQAKASGELPAKAKDPRDTKSNS